jgi:hypothetical protein
MKPETILDIGTWQGYSAACFAEPGIGKVYTVDKGIYGQADLLARYDNVEIIIQKYDRVARFWKRPIDILHLDADHSYASTLEAFFCFAPYLNDRHIVLFHDVSNFASVGVGVLQAFKKIDGPETLIKRYYEKEFGLGILTHNMDIIKFLEEKYKIGDLNGLETRWINYGMSQRSIDG